MTAAPIPAINVHASLARTYEALARLHGSLSLDPALAPVVREDHRAAAEDAADEAALWRAAS